VVRGVNDREENGAYGAWRGSFVRDESWRVPEAGQFELGIVKEIHEDPFWVGRLTSSKCSRKACELEHREWWAVEDDKTVFMACDVLDGGSDQLEENWIDGFLSPDDEVASRRPEGSVDVVVSEDLPEGAMIAFVSAATAHFEDAG
jgi:hypothetical protein